MILHQEKQWFDRKDDVFFFNAVVLSDAAVAAVIRSRSCIGSQKVLARLPLYKILNPTATA